MIGVPSTSSSPPSSSRRTSSPTKNGFPALRRAIAATIAGSATRPAAATQREIAGSSIPRSVSRRVAGARATADSVAVSRSPDASSFASHRRHEREPRTVESRRERAQQRERLAVRPVEVVEDDEERTSRGGLADRPHQARRAGGSAPPSDRAHRRRGPVRRTRPRRSVVRAPDHDLEIDGDRSRVPPSIHGSPESTASTPGASSSSAEPHTTSKPRHAPRPPAPVHQPRLADPGVAGDQDEPSVTHGRRRQLTDEDRQLPLAPDEYGRRRAPAPDRAEAARRADPTGRRRVTVALLLPPVASLLPPTIRGGLAVRICRQGA